jgi:serine/threonine protein kinase/tetratricopeptide (TPR) repeat protein
MERIGRYELRDKLGQGGMGVVYRAFDTLLQRIVAVKVISATIDGNPDLRERFFREARAAGQLSHRNIITIHDLGEDAGVPYLAMEYLEGEDLQRRMAGHDRMSLSHKLDLAIEVCQGLEFAHTHAVVHRDIKPANIFITDNGTVKLLDFGLARLVTSELTHSNMMMGTLNYMAPEQVRGERADHRSDIFATGVVLYELLSGRKAFQGDSFAATLYKILQEVPEPLDRIDSTLPWQMVAIVERALAKPRDERYQLMSEMLRDLLTVRQQQVFSESPTGYRSVTGAFPSPLPQPAPGTAAQRPPSGGQRPPSGGQRPPSGGQRPPSGGQRPASGGQQPPTDLDVTGQYNPPPIQVVSPQPTPAPAPVAPASRGPRAIVVIVMLGALALVVGGPIAYSLLSRRTPTAPVQPSSPATATSDDPAIQAAVKQSLNAFQSGDYAGAARYADSVLLQIPNHPEARRIAARAREAADTIDRGLRDARSLFDAGRYDDAAEAAGSVLSVSPSNADAKRIMAESSARSRGRAVDDARARMAQAKSAAVAAAAPKLASSSYGVGLAAEREAARLQKAGRVSDAAAKFYEAGGLFRSAEIAAQTAGAVTGQRAAAPTAPPPAQPASPAPEPATNPTLPSMPVTPVERPTVPAPVPAPVVPPSAPATAPPPAAAPASPPAQPAPDPAAVNAAAENAVRDVLGRYELALESRSMEALKRIWPSLGGTQQSAIRNEFEHARRIDVDLVDPHISVSGATATVTFVRHYELLPVGGPLQRADTPATMTLRRADGGWVIDQLRFGSPR